MLLKSDKIVACVARRWGQLGDNGLVEEALAGAAGREFLRAIIASRNYALTDWTSKDRMPRLAVSANQ
jgi:hypothetical protein